MEQVPHQAHGLINVVKECFVPGAEIVEAGFSVGRPGEAVFRALTPTREAYIAFPAVARKGIALFVTEATLLLGAD